MIFNRDFHNHDYSVNYSSLSLHTFQRETAQTFSLRFTFDEMQFGILPASKFEATFASNLT